MRRKGPFGDCVPVWFLRSDAGHRPLLLVYYVAISSIIVFLALTSHQRAVKTSLCLNFNASVLLKLLPLQGCSVSAHLSAQLSSRFLHQYIIHLMSAVDSYCPETVSLWGHFPYLLWIIFSLQANPPAGDALFRHLNQATVTTAEKQSACV